MQKEKQARKEIQPEAFSEGPVSKLPPVREKPARLSPEKLLKLLESAYRKGERDSFNKLLAKLSKIEEEELKKILYKGGLASYFSAMALSKIASKTAILTLLEVIIRKDVPEGLQPDQWIEIKTSAQGAFIEGIKSDNAIPVLEEIAKTHQDPLARTISTSRLFDLDPSTRVPVDQIYYDTDPGVRINSATLLSRYEDTKTSVTTLSYALLYDPHSGVRSQAALSLGEIKTPEAKDALQKGLEKEEDPAVIKSIQSALQMFE